MKKKIIERARNIPVERHRLCFAILRLVKGKKNSEIAAKAGISHQTILNWRKPVDDGGVLCPRIDALEKVARAFGMKLAFIDIHEPKMASKHRDDRNGVSAYN